ncbi:hypothetical protein [Fusibacter sp. 3D3]|uniref:hypothetical protein n=1 Tax=Fusibacter sp. 3D3 TaxID=1048380 RepID=UPI000852B042|nr:hypothetical protein [Fusibacter sp. 3D3]
MIVFLVILWGISIIGLPLILYSLMIEKKVSTQYMILLALILIGWGYWLLPVKPNIKALESSDCFIIAEENIKLDSSQKEHLLNLIQNTNLIHVASESEFADLGGKNDIVIIFDLPGKDFYIYLQPDIENYAHIVYRGQYFRFDNYALYEAFFRSMGAV